MTQDAVCTHTFAYFIPDLFYIFTGMRFALMQVKTGLCHILSRFEVAPCKDTPVPIVFDTTAFLLTPNGEIPLSFKRTL
jgi:cytochrome P450 family 6